MSQENLKFATTEIVVLHDFFTRWFNGTLDRDGPELDDIFIRRMAPGFINIQPSGLILPRDTLVDSIRGAHGQNAEFHITIEDVNIRQTFEDGLILATYVECQTGARNSAAENKRLSSVLMRLRGDFADWYWVHETGL